MADDMELVREFATRRSDAAFETLVSRHINLIYSVALRQVRDPHLAQEVAQAVFIILARKAGSLGSKTILSGWLFRTAQYASADALKTRTPPTAPRTGGLHAIHLELWRQRPVATDR